jgi:hypothetical protein
MILSFLDWNKLNEARDKAALLQDFREKSGENSAEAVASLDFLLSSGLIDESGYNAEIKKILDTFTKWMKGNALNPREKEDLEILLEIAEESGIAALRALSSDGAKALFDQGLHLVSSPTQLANGNLVFSLDPNYRSKNGWGIGFFPGPKRIRRMTPKGINLGIWGRYHGSMDVTIKRFLNTSTDSEFFDMAMQWAAENVDFEHAKLYPEEGQWKYYKKKKGKATTRDEADDILVKAEDMVRKAKAIFNDDRWLGNMENSLAEYYEKLIEISELRLKAFELKGDAQKIKDELQDIERLKKQIIEVKNKGL